MRPFTIVSFHILSFVFLSSCFQPLRSFDKAKKPAVPDYSLEKSWAALPTKKDSADAIPLNSGLKDGQATAQVDVFFVYPTIFLFKNHWNASLKYKKLNRKIDKGTIRNQASVFNGSCKVYSPRYRQAVLAAYSDKKGNGTKAFELAYTDVKTAFEYYMKNYNKGRPIIIASHSQGTDHALRLVQDYFEKDPILYKQLVAAYLIGRPIPENTCKVLVPCDSASQIGCFITWNTVRFGEPTFYYLSVSNLECINPLSWKRDTVAVSASLNKGSLPLSFKTLDAGMADAKRAPSGLLWTHVKKQKGYPDIKFYHVADYNLFYMNIRENVQLRVDNYLRIHKKN